MYQDDRSREYLETQAKLSGCDLYEGSTKQLLLDLDSEDAWKVFRRNLPILRALPWISIDLIESHLSRSGNLHAIVDLAEELQSRERILLESLLGSDLVRGCLNLIRDELQVHGLASCLFVPKNAQETPVEWQKQAIGEIERVEWLTWEPEYPTGGDR